MQKWTLAHFSGKQIFLGEILISKISTNIWTGFEFLESKWFLRNSSPRIHKPEKHLKAMRQSLRHGCPLLLIIEMKSSIFLRIRREIAVVGLLPVWLKGRWKKDPFYFSRENSFWLKRLWHVTKLWYFKWLIYLGSYELLFTKEGIFLLPQSVKTLVFNRVKTAICSFCVWQWSRIKQTRQFLIIEMNAVKFIKKSYGAPFDLLSILSLKLTFVPENSLVLFPTKRLSHIKQLERGILDYSLF